MEGSKATAERQACEIPGLHEVPYQASAQNQREQKWFARAARRQGQLVVIRAKLSFCRMNRVSRSAAHYTCWSRGRCYV